MSFRIALISIFALALLPFAAQAKALNDRMAAYHKTMVALDAARPNACVGTYVEDHFTQTESYLVGKFVVGVVKDGQVHWPAEASDIVVHDFPGGVEASYMLAGVKVFTRIMPLLTGRKADTWDGAALFAVHTEPSMPVRVRCGGAAVASFEKPRAAWLRDDRSGGENDEAVMQDRTVILHSKCHPLSVAVCGNGEVVLSPGTDESQIEVCAAFSFPAGEGYVALAFAKTAEAACALLPASYAAAEKTVESYYADLLRSSVDTPDAAINEAFRNAILTLEYNWLAPYGWVECIHHWYSLWHMQHSGAADWLGQQDRVRDCLLSHAAKLMPNGAVPQLSPGGFVHRDFGGSNQFYAWQIRHYLRSTNDPTAEAEFTPVLDRLITQTFSENDPDHDLLLAWGQQIGNQEDYVSTQFNGTSPTIEGIQMLRTRAMIGRDESAERCEAQERVMIERLRATLWQRDLGRFAFFEDPLGIKRLDGQYHTFLYPVIWNIVDPLDGYTSVRHVLDRLTGPNGEVYCSNNFPYHAIGTWGMQAGAAQHPWAAWGFAAMGLNSETWRPLHAAAAWVTNEDHAGSWPEVSTESTAAYFSPPAGLFIQSTIEALFGLDVDGNTLTVSPSFPDAWPRADLTLPDYHALYEHKGNAFRYVVSSDRSSRRQIHWHFPPGRIERFAVNGRETDFQVTSHVNGFWLEANIDEAKETEFTVSFAPAKYRIEAPGSIAEGEPLTVNAIGCRIVGIEDRCGVLESYRSLLEGISAVLRRGILTPYEGYGRLGGMNFARRTFFIECEIPDGPRFHVPVDFAVLPRYEAAQTGAYVANGDSIEFDFLVRNNTESDLQGIMVLHAAQMPSEVPVHLSVAPRSEQHVKIAVSRAWAGLFSPGENRAELWMPDGETLPVNLDLNDLFNKEHVLADYARSRIVSIPLPEDRLRPDTEWRDWRTFYAYGHGPWNGSKPPLEALNGADVGTPDLPGVVFKPAGRRLLPVSRAIGQPFVTLDMQGRMLRKIYVLVVPFLDNHDTFSPVGRATVRAEHNRVIERTLHFPGDLDWWCPEQVVGDFATAKPARSDRFGLLPLLPRDAADWDIAKPPLFPQPEYWATCAAVKTASANMNVVEIDLGSPTEVQSLTIESIGQDPALGIVAVDIEQCSGQSALQGTPWEVPLTEPERLFAFNDPDDAKGWTFDGNAFSVAPVPSLFAQPTLNSLAAAGEGAEGRAVSPTFTITRDFLSVRFHGGRAKADDGPGTLELRVVDVDTGEVLGRLKGPGTHILQEQKIPLKNHRGRKARIELIDQNADASFAWIGLKEATLTSQ